jgi:hypothetical protein
MTDRRQRILQGLDVANLVGVEIGALASPLVTRDDGPIIYVDHLATEDLRKKYDWDPTVDAAKIVSVDAIWGETTLREALGSRGPVDYIVASHVIEHVPDLISWLGELHDALKPDGQVRLAVPDRRYTFDYLRRESDLADILNAFVLKARRPRPISILDFTLNAAKVDQIEAWSTRLDPAKLPKFCEPAGALDTARDAADNGAYHDVHCWVFTPASFIDQFRQAASLGLIPFVCDSFQPTVQNDIEFLVTLSACNDKARILESWDRLAARFPFESTRARADRHADELAAAQAALRDAEARLAAATAEGTAARQEVAALRTSTSWRLTAPVRALKRLSRRDPAAAWPSRSPPN